MEINMRVDKEKNHNKVAKDVLLNPLKTQRERAEDLWLWKTTIQEHLQEVKTTKDDRIISITNTDLNIVEKGQKEIDRRLSESEELSKMRTVEISQVLKESTARYSLFRWSATDEQWGLKLPDVTFQIINPNGNEEDTSETI